jgi:hypothetical protein
VQETSVIESTVHAEEEDPEAASMRLSITVCCTEREGLEEGG